MMTRIARLILQTLAALPLPAIHFLGALLGKSLYYLSPRFRVRMRENLKTSEIAGSYQLYESLVKQSAAETGKGALELAIPWCREPAYVSSLVRQCDGWEHVEAAIAAGHGIIFVTPHLGSYDIAGRYIADHLPCPLTAMYRPPKLSWLEPIMNEGRERGSTRTAPATGAGVRQLMKALLPHCRPAGGRGRN